MDERDYDVVIVGAGSAGMAAAEELADSGTQACIVSAEDRLPYKRTKISKHIAAGFLRDEFAMKPAEWYTEHRIDLVFGDAVVEIDVADKLVRTASGKVLRWKSLLLATGGAARRIDGPDHTAGVHVVHTAADVEDLIAGLNSDERVLVVGGGVLGVEISDQLASRGLDVSLAVAAERLMPRQLNEHASEILLGEFGAAGVGVTFGCPIWEYGNGTTNRFSVTISGVAKGFDRVIAAIGIIPDVELAKRAGLSTSRGILVNDRLETSAPGVYAAGDVAEHPDGSITHLWHAAEHQGRIAAQNILGADRRDVDVPFRLKCEVFGRYFFSIGMPVEGDDVEAVEDAASYYRCLYFVDDRLAAVVMIDDPGRAKAYERAVRERWDRDRVTSELPA